MGIKVGFQGVRFRPRTMRFGGAHEPKILVWKIAKTLTIILKSTRPAVGQAEV